MCDMSSYFATNAGGYGPQSNAHEQYNEDTHHHALSQCHENGRGLHYQSYSQMQYSGNGAVQGQPNHPRFPPFDRLEIKPLDGTNQHEPSPYYSCSGGSQALAGVMGNSQHQVPSGTQTQAQGLTSVYDCGNRGPLTPPHDQPQQYTSCKMQQSLHQHGDIIQGGHNIMIPGSPTHQIHGPQSATQLYQGTIDSAHDTGSSIIYPWMKNQFGECNILFYQIFFLLLFHKK